MNELIASLIRRAYQEEEALDQLFAIVSDPSADVLQRRAALEGLRELAIASRVLKERNVQLITMLRGLVEDPDQELRETAISMLAQRKDEFVQRRLLDGLERREEPLVDDAQAIVLLGNDIHAGFIPTMRRLAKESPDQAVRLEATKLLAADPASADLLFEIFDDKGEDDEVRRASASALMSVARERFEPRAKEAVLDEDDTEQVRAASLTALTHFAGPEQIDSDFIARVANVDTDQVRAASLTNVDTSSSERIVAPAADAFKVREGDLAKAVRIFKERHGRS
jgi:hypothetical protein